MVSEKALENWIIIYAKDLIPWEMRGPSRSSPEKDQNGFFHSSSQEFIKSHFSEAAKELQADKVIQGVSWIYSNMKQGIITSYLPLQLISANCLPSAIQAKELQCLLLPKVCVACFNTLSRQNTTSVLLSSFILVILVSVFLLYLFIIFFIIIYPPCKSLKPYFC